MIFRGIHNKLEKYIVRNGVPRIVVDFDMKLAESKCEYVANHTLDSGPKVWVVTFP